MKVVIRENARFERTGSINFGWGNGYVLIPENNVLHGKHYDDIDVNIHGGLTFSELVDNDMVEKWQLDRTDLGKWCVGFDTFHFRDCLSNWSKEQVQLEAERLREQLMSYEAGL